jgi:hypothetical protein
VKHAAIERKLAKNWQFWMLMLSRRDRDRRGVRGVERELRAIGAGAEADDRDTGDVER